MLGRCFVLVALVACGDNRSERIAAPTGVVASDGTSPEAVTVTWAAVAGVTRYRVWRDGEPIAVVSAPTYKDATATVGDISPPVLTASTGTYGDRVELEWSLSVGVPGPMHDYFVTALQDDDESTPSSSDTGYLGAHEVLRYGISIDGGQTFPIGTTETHYADTTAPVGTFSGSGTVSASDGTSTAHIAVTATPMVMNGSARSYVVQAVTTAGTLVSNVAQGARGAALIYQWYRYDGGVRTAITSATGPTFVDETTPAGRAFAYDCTISEAGGLAVTTKPDFGWRAPRPTERPRLDTWVANRRVFDAAVAADAIYIAGSFDYVGPPTGAFAAIDAATGTASLSPTRVTTSVDDFNLLGVAAAVRDGAGGWYLGGDFEAVSGVPQARLVRVAATGEPDPTFQPVILDGGVRSIAIDGNTIFIAGTFTSVAWESRNGFAALDATTGALEPLALALTPNFAHIDRVHARAGVLFVAGLFSSIDGVQRNGIAAIDIASGMVTSWDAQSTSAFVALEATTSNTLYVTGSFTSIGGQTRNGLAELDATTGSATAFNPAQAIGVVVRSGGSVFGARVLENTSELELTTLDATNGALLARHTVAVDIANASTDVVLAASGSTLYVGGDFKIAGAQPRTRLAAFDASTGALLAWAPISPNLVRSIQVDGNTIFVGGPFVSVGGQRRGGIAALSPTTGSLLPWDPALAGPFPSVHALALVGNALYIGGRFSGVGASPRSSLACLERATGTATPWTADLDGSYSSFVTNFVIRANTLYVTGWFQTIGGEARTSLGAVDLTTGVVLPWNPNANPEYQVMRMGKMAVDGTTIYLAGGFQHLGGAERFALAGIDALTGQVTSWDPKATSGGMNDLVVSGGRLYLGGYFDYFDVFGPNPQTRLGIAVFDLPAGALSTWMTPMTLGSRVSALGIVGNTIYATGEITLPARAANGAGAFDVNTGNIAPWNPSWIGKYEMLGIADRIVPAGTSLVIVGDMHDVAAYPRRGIAIFDL